MIIITGVSKGIGRFLYEKFSQFDEEVIGIYNTTIPKYDNSKNLYKLDISNYNEVENFYKTVEKKISKIYYKFKFRRINILNYSKYYKCEIKLFNFHDNCLTKLNSAK